MVILFTILFFVVLYVIFYFKNKDKKIENDYNNIKFDNGRHPGLLNQPQMPFAMEPKDDTEKGSAFMTMLSLRNPILLLSPQRRKLTENYLKSVAGGNGSFNGLTPILLE